MEEKKSKLIGDKIKAWRKKREITQDALAKKANIPYTTLAKIESGVIKNPSIRTVMKIAGGLDVSLDSLVKN